MNRYLQRVRGITLREVRFRTLEAAAVAGERLRFASGRPQWQRQKLAMLLVPDCELLGQAREAIARTDWVGAGTALRSHFIRRPRRFVIHPASRPVVASEIAARFPDSPERAIQQAAPLLRGRYSLLGYEDLSFACDGADIDWQLDPVHGRRAPGTFWNGIRYLDPRFGDHKVIWELNRHQHWLALGRAAWLTDDPRYRARFHRELSSWLAANPPLTGINWASMLELAFRSISWVWALHFFAAFDEDPVWVVDLLIGLEGQLSHIARHLSYYFSPNTHLLGEGLALYVAGRSLPELKPARRWEAIGRAILLEEASAQINADGGHAELSAHYHRYALDFYLLALAVARASGDLESHRFTVATDRLASYCRSIASDDGLLPALGDDDGGMLFPICRRAPADASDSLALAAALLGRSDLAVSEAPEEVLWMLGGDASLVSRDPSRWEPTSRLFPDTGYAILRSRTGHAILDVGRHGFLNGGHAHADALALVLTLRGQPLLVDPGTATYTMDPGVRDRFRSTVMHNTAVIDSRPQSEPAGPFHWRTRADAIVVAWHPHAACDYVEGEHDGYRPDVVHRRALLRAGDDAWVVIDHVLGSGLRRADVLWHFEPSWTRVAGEGPGIQLRNRKGLAACMASSANLTAEYCGDQDGLGWCAPAYGRMIPSVALRFSLEEPAPFSIVTAIVPSLRVAIRQEAVVAAQPDEWHRVGASILHGTTRVLVVVATGPAGSRDRSTDPAVRSPHRVMLAEGELVTDALASVLRWSGSSLCSVDLFGVRQARWSGAGSFQLQAMRAAQDLHFDRVALEQLNRTGVAERAG